MFGISAEHLVILAIVLLLFGPRRLPELGYTLGKAIRNFKDSMAGVEEARFRRVEQGEGVASAAAAVTAQNVPAAPGAAAAPNVAVAAPAASTQASEETAAPAPTVRA